MGFVETYFLNPIKVEQGYNYLNTIVYALIAFGCIWLISRLLLKTKSKVDIKFLVQLLTFVGIGSFLRVIIDKREIQRAFWNVSPGIYLTITTIFLFSFVFSILLERKAKFKSWKTVTVLGSSVLIVLITASFPLRFIHILPAVFILLMFILLTLSFHLIFERAKANWIMKPLPFLAFSAQLFDATVTSFLVQYFGAVEKHPLPRLIMEKVGTAFAFYPIKILVVLFAVYYIIKEVDNKTFRNLLIVSILILGLAQGLRNILGFVIY